LDTDIPDKVQRDKVKHDLLRVDVFLEDLLSYATETAVSSPDQFKPPAATTWRLVEDLVWLIVTDKFQGLANTDQVVCGLARGNIGKQVDQKAVAEHIVKAHNDAVAALLQQKQEVLELLQKIVVTEGEDEGVVLLSNDGPCHPETDPRDPTQTMQVYDHYFFSPLGDALIRLHRKLIGKEMPFDEAKTVKAEE
jgi:hypothetical protein